MPIASRLPARATRHCGPAGTGSDGFVPLDDVDDLARPVKRAKWSGACETALPTAKRQNSQNGWEDTAAPDGPTRGYCRGAASSRTSIISKPVSGL
jgi:hypothetical protein